MLVVNTNRSKPIGQRGYPGVEPLNDRIAGTQYRCCYDTIDPNFNHSIPEAIIPRKTSRYQLMVDKKYSVAYTRENPTCR